MSGIGKPSGGVGSPFKAKLEHMPAGESAMKQVEEETKTFGENVQSIVGGVGGALGNIEQGVTNFLSSIGLKPKPLAAPEEGDLATQADIDKARNKIKVSKYQWDTGGSNFWQTQNINREKKKLGLKGKMNEESGVREYNEFNIFTGKVNTYQFDPQSGEYVVKGEVTEKPEEEENVLETVNNDFEKDIFDYMDVLGVSLKDTPGKDMTEVTSDFVAGVEDEHVKSLQQALLEMGYELPKYGADGKWGKETKNAVKEFLSDYNPEEHMTATDGGVGGEQEEEVVESPDGGVTPPKEDLSDKSTNELREMLKDAPYHSEQRKEIYDKLGWKHDKTVDKTITEDPSDKVGDKLEEQVTDTEALVDDKGVIPENEQYTYYNPDLKSEETIRITNDDVKKGMSDTRHLQSKKVLEDLLGTEISDRDYLLDYTNTLVEDDDPRLKELNSPQGINSNLIIKDEIKFKKLVWNAWKKWNNQAHNKNLDSWDTIKNAYNINDRMMMALGEKFNKEHKDKKVNLN